MRLKMNFEKLSFCIKSLKRTFFFARFCFKLYVRSSLQCRIQGLLSSNEIVSTVVKASISRKLSLSRDKFSAHNIYVRNNKTWYLFFSKQSSKCSSYDVFQAPVTHFRHCHIQYRPTTT